MKILSVFNHKKQKKINPNLEIWKRMFFLKVINSPKNKIKHFNQIFDWLENLLLTRILSNTGPVGPSLLTRDDFEYYVDQLTAAKNKFVDKESARVEKQLEAQT